MAIVLRKARRLPVALRTFPVFAAAMARALDPSIGCGDKRCEFTARDGKSSDRKWSRDGYPDLILRLARRHLARRGAHHEIAGRHGNHFGAVGTIFEGFTCPGPDTAVFCSADLDANVLTGLCRRVACHKRAKNRQRDNPCIPRQASHGTPRLREAAAHLTPPANSPPA